ncbi:MAG TPA: DUF3035 domain-containing protein [Allosphingosinicella sp.]|jgi:hypothetical protein|nr:DUF3035 domain-containing protein [Allosphingosinicella sp.]
MRIVKVTLAASVAALLLSGCASHRIANRGRPDEFAVVRSQPLVIPPDYSLVPPRAGEPSPQAADPRQEALEALFGGPAPRSKAETTMLDAAGNDHVADGARSVAGDPNTQVVDKGAATQAIVAAPATTGQTATVSTPQ